MTIGLLGRKVGMTRVFKEDGRSVPVTVVEVVPNRISQIKTLENDGYVSLQLTGGQKKSSHVNKPLTGHFAKAKIEAGDMIKEYPVETTEGYELGQVISVGDLFQEGHYVDVIGTSKGKGFAGTVKRHNFRTQDMSHGNSRSHRVPGSIGQNQTPGKVFKGKKMCGHLGNEQVTVQSLEVIRVENEKNIILIKGAIPGATGSKVQVSPAVKIKQGDN